LVRAVLVWTVVLVSIVLPRIQPPPAPASPAVTQFSSYQAQSMTQAAHDQKAQAQRQAVAQAWTSEYTKSYEAYQAKLQAEAEAQAEAARIAARRAHLPAIGEGLALGRDLEDLELEDRLLLARALEQHRLVVDYRHLVQQRVTGGLRHQHPRRPHLRQVCAVVHRHADERELEPLGRPDVPGDHLARVEPD